MDRIVTVVGLLVLFTSQFIISGCGISESAVREIVHEEIKKDRENYAQSFAFQKFGFGGALEKEWSHSQGVKAGNLIFVAGQQPYDTNLDENGMPLTDKETGKSFAEQLRTVLENIEKVLANYGATMDDIMFLQGFVDEQAGKNAAEFSFPSRIELLERLFELELQWKGEHLGLLEMRKLYRWFLRGYPGMKYFRRKLATALGADEVKALLKALREEIGG